MRHFVVVLLGVILLTSCATFQEPKTLSHIKTNLDCIEYKEGINWGQISGRFGTPDVAPLPEPGTDLSRNTRIYKDKVIIFYTERQEVKEGERVRFHEAISKIELCKEK